MSRDVELVAPFHLEYTYKRSTGPVIGRFLTELRDGRLVGVRTKSGDVLFPAQEYDARTGASVTDAWVEVGPEGTILTWTWVAEPTAGQPSTEPFAYALVQLDGADTPVLHVVRGPESGVRTGARVRAVLAERRTGTIHDLAGFEVIP